MATSQKLGLHAFQDVSTVLAEIGYPASDIHSLSVEGKILASANTRKSSTWREYEIFAVRLHFAHSADEYRTTHRSIKVKDGSIDLDKVKSKIDEMLNLYAEAELRLQQQQQQEKERDNLFNLVAAKCDSMGVNRQQDVQGINIKRIIEYGQVSLVLENLTPTQAAKVIKALES